MTGLSNIPLAAFLKITEQYLIHTSTTPRLDALILLEYASERPRDWLLAHSDKSADILQERYLQRYREFIERRAQGEPLAYITGTKEFYGLDLEVSPDVMIPRPESETLVDYALKYTPEHGSVLDMGTGSGALAIALKHHRPDLDIHGCDISPEALVISRRNATQHDTEITFSKSELFAAYPGRRFDALLANLPYLPDNYSGSLEIQAEPATALYAGSDGLDIYRHFFAQLPEHTKEDTLLVVEHLPDQSQPVTALACKAGFEAAERLDDFCTLLTRTG